MTPEPAAVPSTVSSPWEDAVHAAALLAVDPAGAGGVVVRALPGPVRDRWLGILRGLLPADAPWRRVPLHVDDDRLLGGLDLAATLAAGRPVAARGLLADADGGMLLLAMAERASAALAARLSPVLDTGGVVVERDGLTERVETRVGVVALDEGIAEDETPPAALCERLAFRVDLGDIRLADATVHGPPPDVATARARLRGVVADEDVVRALCATALALGIDSVRAPQLAVRVARAAASLAGRSTVGEEDAQLAARLVLAPRAQCLPEAAPPPEAQESEPPQQDDEQQRRKDEQPEHEARHPAPPTDAEDTADGPDDRTVPSDADRPDGRIDDRVLAAAAAAVPPDLLDRIRLGDAARSGPAAAGTAGIARSALRGRPVGVRRGRHDGGARLNVVETLRAAAPWQRIRRAEARARSTRRARTPRVEVRGDDVRTTRFEQRTETTTIFAVDASGSTVLERLAEAKGAVERLLAECYVRRDQVALLAFRGAGAELLLPATRSLTRARRCLAGLAGGGGTPLAAGIDAASEVARNVARRGGTPLVVFLTDGRANVARDGGGGRQRAEADAMAAARVLHSSGVASLVIDTSSRPRPAGESLARAMGAGYVPLPHADGAALSAAVRDATAAIESGAR